VVAPDLAGWRCERLAGGTDVKYFTIVPDWICEVLSPSNAMHDRSKKLPLYAANGVRAEPFEAIELDLSLLWAHLPKPQPTRASEIAAEYAAHAAK
jgi:hypothetical protein